MTADEVHGSDPELRAELEPRSAGYVFAVAPDHRISTGAGRVRAGGDGKDSAAAAR
ncbi:hypothetical protein OG563_47745 [Nocardia vinacea]|uniref:Uncharacterized protein n=1 Tax=Nocardia vinacea TaxID=96468 RepID=A0ABZ1YXM5_9NOCA|nr:hypothetical protein [Nocardia vinacea]